MTVDLPAADDANWSLICYYTFFMHKLESVLLTVPTLLQCQLARMCRGSCLREGSLDPPEITYQLQRRYLGASVRAIGILVRLQPAYSAEQG
jgi:hypothetical protein